MSPWCDAESDTGTIWLVTFTYIYRVGVVKRFKDLFVNEMHIIYSFLVSSLNCKPSLNSPDWWGYRSWFRLCFFRKVMLLRIAYKRKSDSLVIFHFLSLIQIYKFLARIWRRTAPSTSLIDLHFEATGLEICIRWSPLCVLKCVRFTLTYNISLSALSVYNGPFWIRHMPGTADIRQAWHKFGVRLRFLNNVPSPVGPNRLSVSFILMQIFSRF